MLLKERLMDHKKIWSFLRIIDRHIKAQQADRNFYKKNNRINWKNYQDCKSYYNSLKAKIIDEINSYNRNMKKISMEKKVYGNIKITNLTMLSNNGDQMGKVFLYDNRIYRGIYKDRVSDFLTIWNKGVLQVLWRHSYIPELTISEFYTEEFPLIVETKKVSIQKNMVWSYGMIKDACILISFLQEVLNEYDCTLLDGHLNNVTFYHGRPLFVDIGSIIPFRHTAVQEELVFCGLFRLLFGFLGNCMLYRMPVFDMSSGTAFVAPRFYNQLTRDYRFCLSKFKKYHLFHGNLLSIKLVYKIFSLYSVAPEDIDILFPIKEQREINEIVIEDDEIEEIVSYIGKQSIVDVGGGFELIDCLARKGLKSTIVSFLDFDEFRLDDVYMKLKERDFYAMTSLINYIYIQNDENLSNYKRDIVICVSPFENSMSYQGMNVKTIAYQLNLIGEKGIFVILKKGEFDKQGKDLVALYESLQEYYYMDTVQSVNNLYIFWKGKRY